MKSYSNKIYVAYKPCKKPELTLQTNGYGGKNPLFKNVTALGLGYFEDEIGYYMIRGELKLDIT